MIGDYTDQTAQGTYMDAEHSELFLPRGLFRTTGGVSKRTLRFGPHGGPTGFSLEVTKVTGGGGAC